MSIESPVGTLDIKNATLRVGKLEVSNIQGIDTALNVTRANSVLIYDDQASTTTFNGTTSSAGVRDTVNGYLDVSTGYVYWGQKLPNSWVMDFEMDIRSGTNAGSLYANVFSTTNTGGDGYSFTFNDSNDKITLKYDGTTLTESTVSGLFTASESWQKVVINYERGLIAISVGGSRKFYYKDIERETPYTTGEYISFSSASTDGRKIRDLRIVNGEKWVYAGESNVVYTQGSVGVGVTDPTTALDVSGTVKATALEGDGSAITNISSANVGDFASNVTRIETLETDLGSNATRVSTLETDLGSNVARIGTLETDLGSNVTRIGTLETDLGSNVARIGTLETDLGSNVTRITSIESGDHTFTGIKTFENDVVLESNLRVQGDLLVANTVNMTVSDPILELGSNNLNTGDIGLVMTRHGASNSNVAVFFDETADTLKLGYTLNGANDTTLELDSNALTVSVQGALTAASVSGDGSGLTSLNANNVSSGILTRPISTTTGTFSGDVGIGTASPRALLDVCGPVNIPAILTSGAGSSEGDIAVISGEALQIGHWDVGTTTFTNRIHVTSGGNVGVGTTNPGYKLDVRGSANVASLNITDTTHSTSTTTGALKVAGGLGVASNIHIGGETILGTAIYRKRRDWDRSALAYVYLGNVRTNDTTGIRLDVSLNNSNSGYTMYQFQITLNGNDSDHSGGQLVYSAQGTRNDTVLRSIEIGYVYVGTGGSYEYQLWLEDPTTSTAGGMDAYLNCQGYYNFDTGVSDVAHGGSAPTNFNSGIVGVLVDTFGNVGIGTASPQLELHVHDANNNSSGIIVSSTTDYARLYAAGGQFYIQSGTAASADSRADINFTSMYASTTYMKIRGSDGNVGIGTSPGAKLDIFSSSTDPGAVPTLHVGDGVVDYGDYGMLQLTRHATSGGSKAHAAFIRNGNTVFGMGFHNNTNTFGFWPSFSTVTNTPTMSFTSGGNVGIGTASPVGKFDVWDGASNGTNVQQNAFFYLRNPANAATNYGAAIVFENTDGAAGTRKGLGRIAALRENNAANYSSYLQFSPTVAGTEFEAMRITSAGNVGIGTTSPEDNVHIYSSETGGTQLKIENASASGDTRAGLFLQTRSSNVFALQFTPSAEQIVFDNKGQGGYAFYQKNGGGTTNLSAVIDKDGNVGIGTASPSVALDISGQLNVSAGLKTIQLFNSNLTVSAGAWNDIGDFSGMSNGCYLLTVRWGNSSNPLVYWYGGASGVIYMRGGANVSYNSQAGEDLRLNHWYHYRTVGEFEFILDSDNASGNYGNTTLWVKSAASTTINFTTHMTLLHNV